MPDQSTLLMYILGNRLIQTTYTTVMFLREAKPDISKQQRSHFYFQFILHSQITLQSIPPFLHIYITSEHAHHCGGQKHLLQLSPSCSCWRLSGSITLRPSLLPFVLAPIKGEGMSSFSLESPPWMTPSGPTSPRKEEVANSDDAGLV